MSPAWLASIGAGLASALLMMTLMAGPAGIISGSLAPLPLFAAGLGLGFKGAAVAGASMLVVFGLAAGPLAALGLFAVVVAPICLLVQRALLWREVPSEADPGQGAVEWYPLGGLVCWLAGLGFIWLALAAAVFATGEGGLQQAVQAEIARSLGLLAPEMPTGERALLAEGFAGLALGVSLASWTLMLAVNGALAQGLLVRFKRNIRPSPDIAMIELPNWAGPVLILIAAGAFLLPGEIGFLAENLLPVAMLPFFFVGLGVVHTLARRLSARTLFLVISYGVLILLSWTAILVAALGVIEQWARFRQRMTVVKRAEEDEECK